MTILAYHPQCNREVCTHHQEVGRGTEFFAAEDRWRKQGVNIDGVWPRRIDQVDAALRKWLAGESHPDDLVWSIWGYHLLTDVNNQAIIEDPYDIIAGWKGLLRVYPAALKTAILKRHLESVRVLAHRLPLPQQGRARRRRVPGRPDTAAGARPDPDSVCA
jgi:hypothetical protein